MQQKEAGSNLRAARAAGVPNILPVFFCTAAGTRLQVALLPPIACRSNRPFITSSHSRAAAGSSFSQAAMSCPKFILLAVIIAVAATSCAAQMLATANYANGNCMGAIVEKGSATVGKCTLTSRTLYAQGSLSGTVRFADGDATVHSTLRSSFVLSFVLDLN